MPGRRNLLRIPMKADTCSNSYRTPFQSCRTVFGAKRRSEGVIKGCPTGVKVLPSVWLSFGAPPRGDVLAVNPKPNLRRLFVLAGRAAATNFEPQFALPPVATRNGLAPASANRRTCGSGTLVFIFRRSGFCFAQGFAFELDPIGVVNQPIQDGIGHRRVGNNFVPLADRELAGNERGPLALAVVEHLQELAI